MALTPEDVVNKRFQPTKFREGYDQDEVDDFLDEVVVELRRLNQENEELKQKLVSAESSAAGAPVAAAAAPAEVAEPAVAVEPEAAADVETPDEAPTAPVAAVATAVPVAAAVAGADETETSNNLLQLARRLHDEHVAEGATKRDALIAEGQTTAARLVADAENTQKQKLAELEEQRKGLQSKIDELRNFESEYRSKLKSYIEGQLKELDTTGAAAPAAAESAPAAVPAQGVGA